MSESVAGGQMECGQNISISAPITVNVAKMDSDTDLEKVFANASEQLERQIVFRLRNRLEVTSTRGIGYLRR
jgi:hypothetical protein